MTGASVGFRRVLHLIGNDRFVQIIDDLLVRRGQEVLVPLTHGERSADDLDTLEVVSDTLHPLGRDGAGDGSGHDDSRCPVSPGDVARRAGRGTSGESIIDDDDHSVREVHWGSALTIDPNAPSEFRTFGRDHALEIGVRDATRFHRVVLHDEDTIFTNCPHGQFRLEGHANLSNDEHVHRTRQEARDLTSHGNASARESEYHDVFVPQRRGESPTQTTPRVTAIGERFHTSRSSTRTSQAKGASKRRSLSSRIERRHPYRVIAVMTTAYLR